MLINKIIDELSKRIGIKLILIYVKRFYFILFLFLFKCEMI